MKKQHYLILILKILLATNLFAQNEWAPIGAEWHYSVYSSYYPNHEAHLKITAFKDTTVLGTSCTMMENILRGFQDVEYSSYWYTYSLKDSVYFIPPECSDSFRLLYDFTAEVFDSISIPKYCNGPNYFQSKIDSLSTIQVQNITLKQWYLDSMDHVGSNIFSIIENIGGVRHMFPPPEFTTDGDFRYNLRCYIDNNIEYKLRDDCEFWGMVSGVKDYSNTFNFNIYPNPSKAYVKIINSNFSRPLDFLILAMNGTIRLKGKINKQEFEIPISSLEAGVYTIVFYSESGGYHYEKIVKID